MKHLKHRLLQLSPCWHICFEFGSLGACPEHTCSGRCPETSLLPHYPCSCWTPLASYPSQDKFQDCYHRFQGIAFPAAILSRCPCSTGCAHAITAIFLFLVNMHSLTKNHNGKVQVVLVRCLGHLEWVTISSFIYFRSSCFQEETQASSFFKCFPRISTSSTDITLCDDITSTNVNHARCALPPS